MNGVSGISRMNPIECDAVLPAFPFIVLLCLCVLRVLCGEMLLTLILGSSESSGANKCMYARAKQIMTLCCKGMGPSC